MVNLVAVFAVAGWLLATVGWVVVWLLVHELRAQVKRHERLILDYTDDWDRDEQQLWNDKWNDYTSRNPLVFDRMWQLTDLPEDSPLRRTLHEDDVRRWKPSYGRHWDPFYEKDDSDSESPRPHEGTGG